MNVQPDPNSSKHQTSQLHQNHEKTSPHQHVVIVLHIIILILSRIKVKVPRTGWPPRFTISNFYPTHYTHFTHYTCYIHPLYPLYSHYTHCTLTRNTHCTHNFTSHTIRATPTTIPPRYISDLAPLPSFSLLSSNPPISGTSVYITLRKKTRQINQRPTIKQAQNVLRPQPLPPRAFVKKIKLILILNIETAQHLTCRQSSGSFGWKSFILLPISSLDRKEVIQFPSGRPRKPSVIINQRQ